MQEDVKEELEDTVEVELEDSAEADEKVEAKTEAAPEGGEEASEDDLEGYSDKVKKRIEKLTYKMREAERREKAATDYAKSVQQQMEELKTRSSKIDESYLTEYDQRVSTQEEILKTKLTNAINMGDVDAQIEAQKQLAKLAIESERLTVAKAEHEERKTKPAEAQSQEQAQAQQQPAQPDPKAQAWARKNEWFGQDEPMTLTAFSIHKRLVESEFYDPTSDDYYQELDRRMREEFPHKFEENRASQPSNARSPVAPASRSAGKVSSKKIKLSPSQVAIADKLGVSYEQYAKQLARLNS